MGLSCNFVNVYTKLVRIKSPKCHVVLLADVVAFIILAMNFVTVAIFVYTIVYLCKRVHDSSSCTRLHARTSNTFTESESRFV